MKKGLTILLVLAVVVASAVWLSQSVPSAPDFTQYEAGEERKQVFFNYFLPLVREHNATIRERRSQIQQWADSQELSWWDERTLNEWLEMYRVEDFDPEQPDDWQRLLRKVDIVPPSLALAQAANESAWGTSRFARKANNYYGQWCFSDGCGLVPQSRDAGANHEVAAFDSPQQSVQRYMLNLNRHHAYQELRQIRAQLRAKDKPITGLVLAEGLQSYSERGQEYIDELRSMIRYNELDEYDHQNLAAR
ncbi:Protein bax [Saliniradius amylolyticus]|uniref:Protein bax n=1 Tax=Saliniradius amylolyticus TaxID=2183582 RepID=A0A2S2E0W3_9ALTE|nr:glucosaminidase domain-containing protein [Saliniradius amylolyticus]AWL11172.1 Protein bax [Saliniradius amylolyticus]